MSVDRDGDFNWALATAGPAVFSAVIAVGNTVVNLSAGRAPDFVLVMIGSIIVVLFSPATIYFLIEQAAEDRFRAWLLSSIAEIERGEATYNGVRITPNTELRRFEVPVATLIVSFVVQLRPRIVGEDHERVAWISAAIGLVTGWWSLSGLLRTPMLAVSNLRGGTPLTVAQYHAELLANGTASRFQRQREAEAKAKAGRSG